ncbi:MAG: DUF4145 domain-containing protein [Aliivibrio sp.]|uniref:DUF4145 domain-containing protein n=1 Tax=Aliivibrio sp. TaxID=1872443 RepID=UPI001A490157|nr:DUF4145 domain-containing protein [Aliivibrio sp.]
MSDIEFVIVRSRRLENLLKEHYHAEGKGLHHLISSCEERLPHDVIKKMRFIATIRNKIVHEEEYRLDDKSRFKTVFEECEAELVPRSNRFIWRVAIATVLIVTGLALWFYHWHWDEITTHFS